MPPPGPKPRWTWLPWNKYLCTRYGPDWKPHPRRPGRFTYDGTFELTVPLGKRVRFRLKARGRDRSGVKFAARGLPAGAALDPKTGRFKWKAAGKPGDSYTLSFAAVSGKGARNEWPMVLTVADNDLAYAWKAGMGASQRDCTEMVPRYRHWVVDLNGDGKKDVVYTETVAAGQMVFIELADGSSFDSADNLSDTNLVGSAGDMVKIHTAADGSPLVSVFHDCCCTQSYTFLRVQGHEVEQVGHVSVDDTCTDPRNYLTLVTDTRGRVKGIRVHRKGSSRTHKWRAGRFRRFH